MMPANTGTAPQVERCDIRFRNGTIARGVDPRKYRWLLNDPAFPPRSAGDIVRWQEAA
jgi:hypothetical protein